MKIYIFIFLKLRYWVLRYVNIYKIHIVVSLTCVNLTLKLSSFLLKFWKITFFFKSGAFFAKIKQNNFSKFCPFLSSCNIWVQKFFVTSHFHHIFLFQNLLRFLWSIWSVGVWIWNQHLNFDRNMNFWPLFEFLTNICIFTNIWIFDQYLNFWPIFELLTNYTFGAVFVIFSIQWNKITFLNFVLPFLSSCNIRVQKFEQFFVTFSSHFLFQNLLRFLWSVLDGILYIKIFVEQVNVNMTENSGQVPNIENFFYMIP